MKLDSMVPEKMRTKRIIFHTLIVDFVGEIFQEEFMRSLDSVLNNIERGNDVVQDA